MQLPPIDCIRRQHRKTIAQLAAAMLNKRSTAPVIKGHSGSDNRRRVSLWELESYLKIGRAMNCVHLKQTLMTLKAEI